MISNPSRATMHFAKPNEYLNAFFSGADFLALAKKVEDSIVYRNNSDDERMVLSSALDIIQNNVDDKTQANEESKESTIDDSKQ